VANAPLGPDARLGIDKLTIESHLVTALEHLR